MSADKMASLEPFVRKIKPAMDAFLRSHTKENLAKLEHEMNSFNWMELKIFHDQILLPLVLIMEEINQRDEEIRTGTLKCIRIVTSQLYLSNVNALRTIVHMALKQIRDCHTPNIRANLSEELKLATIECINEAFRRSTTDVLETFYGKESEMLLGQVLLTLAELIEKEKYRKLTIASIQCLMAVFYVHEEADCMDVVLRSQVANSLFIFMPKIVTLLFATTLAEEKLGETLKATAIKALGRMLCIIFEETNETFIGAKYNLSEFKTLIDNAVKIGQESACDVGDDVETDKEKESLEVKLGRLKGEGRSSKWFAEASANLHPKFLKTRVLRAHASARIRQEYAQMCCALLTNCAHNLKDSFICLLENVVAMSEDADDGIRSQCKKTLERLQCGHAALPLFDDSAETLFDEHLGKLPRIINRCDEAEQYAELMFIKGFLKNLSPAKIEVLFLLPNNLEMFFMCLLTAVDLKVTRELLIEEISLREMSEHDFVECSKLRWREFKHLSSLRCIQCVKDICEILGSTHGLKRITFDFLLENLTEQNELMNGLILLMLWIATACTDKRRESFELVDILLEELLNDKHWQLAMQPDEVLRLRVDRPSNWFADHTPGLFESAIEIRTQDYDSDDEHESAERNDRVTIAAAQFNILHTCIVLDALGHCALFYGDTFDKYLFRCLHKILLKVASSNTMVYQAANFALVAIQKTLRFAKMTHFIEAYTDTITFYLNAILKRSPESSAAVDILTVVLQFSTSSVLPHLSSIFQTIRNECTKGDQSENINAYLKVYNAFLAQLGRWQLDSTSEVNNVPMQVDAVQDTDLLSSWLAAVQALETNEDDCSFEMQNDTQEIPIESETVQEDAENLNTEPSLPHHIVMIKDILHQAVKFISSKDQAHQILALECIITGLPLLAEYEDELLPLVHTLWQPLVEKFRQKDPIVLNRCFSLLNILATHAKEFILKRSLDHVIPFLKQFLLETARHSAAEKNKVPTQEYKLQSKLLQEFPNLIQSMQIDGKQLNEITDGVALYLSDAQPEELQSYAMEFFILLKAYDGPIAYLAVVKRAHLKEYKKTAIKIFDAFGVL